MKKIIVAIDGYSSCGKSTIAKQLAKYAGYRYIDTGAMYRAVALYAIKQSAISNQQSAISNQQSAVSNQRSAVIGLLPEIHVDLPFSLTAASM